MSSQRNPIIRGGRALSRLQASAPFSVKPIHIHGRPVLPREKIATSEQIREAAEREAEGIRGNAHHDAEMIRGESEREVAAAIAAGRAQGHQEGYESGMAAAQAEMQEALTLVRAVGTEAKAVRDAIIERSEAQLLRLVTAATRRVIGEVAEQTPELVLTAVQEAIKRAGDQRILRVRVHPDTEEIVDVRYGPEDRDWDLRSDSAIAMGGCIIDTEAGVIDASIEGQVAEIEAAWQEVA